MDHQKSSILLISGTLSVGGCGGHGCYFQPNLRVISQISASQKGGGGCSFGFGFQEPFNGDSISSLIKSFYFTLYLLICQLHRSGSALNCG